MTKDGPARPLRLDGQGKPLWLVCELTYKCPLKCPWCNNPLEFGSIRDELSTEEWKRVLRESRALGSLQLGFTGGEPLVRKDLEELVAEADRLGFYTNLITSTVGMDAERLGRLKAAGLKQIQVSLQSHDADTTNTLVGAPVHQHKIDMIREIKAQGFPVVLNIPVVRQNIAHTTAYLELALELGVDYVEFANVQYYNWALVNRDELMPTLEELRESEAAINAFRARIGKRMTIYFVIPDYFNGRPKACMNGWGSIIMTIAPDGLALPCQEARLLEGLDFPSVRDHSVEWIWKDSPAFKTYRGDDWMKEPCRSCDEKEKDFGGCRCQAYLLTGDAANPDPACSKSPFHHKIGQAIVEAHRPLRNSRPLVMRQAGAS
ncbi:pyrroloquinoline quinone biosynthesis protein PqqE [Paramagnetospirillum caucaseum]|uniref:PqqA peptide cyclase n=1 Tax=Paramagnetospirillum caucaseum TaxID=1244869 RepID=M2ZQA2_9PROT|nr:pyrroloquinoline quinone biosynthesis protein PqqE [Paramagnetospirillum caucaseum]EME69497.1 pyrroloquinoline quinone biosynthesis protein PqqE [Paramagnetospirillum caucaseum]